MNWIGYQFDTVEAEGDPKNEFLNIFSYSLL